MGKGKIFIVGVITVILLDSLFILKGAPSSTISDLNVPNSRLNLPKYQQVSFYVGAHQDDWQLFMGVNAYNDILNQNAKTVFIYVTAGDEGSGSGFGHCTNCTIPHFRSREEGAISSLKLVAKQTWPYPKMIHDTIQSCGKIFFIHKYIYSNTVSYFIRLPNRPTTPNLTSFFYSNDALTALVDSTEEPLNDQSNTFQNKEELIELVKRIFLRETGEATALWINTSDPESLKNGNHDDHAEHYITGKICKQAAASIGNSKKIVMAYYTEYCTENMPHNLSLEGVMMESGLFAAYNKSKIDAGWWSEWDVCKKYCSTNYLSVTMIGNTNIAVNDTSKNSFSANSYSIDCLPEKDSSLLKINYSIPEDLGKDDAIYLEFVNSNMEILKKIDQSSKKGIFSTDFNISTYTEGIYFLRLRMRNHSESEVFTTFKVLLTIPKNKNGNVKNNNP